MSRLDLVCNRHVACLGSRAQALELALGHEVLLHDLLLLLRVVQRHVRLDQVLKLASVEGLQPHLVDLVQNLGALLHAKLLEHPVDVRCLSGHGALGRR